MLAIRLPWVYPHQVKPGRAGMEIHPALAGKFHGVGIHISKRHVCNHLFDGPKAHLEGGPWNHQRPNPVITGALRTPDDRPHGLPRYPKGLNLDIRDETYVVFNLKRPSSPTVLRDSR